MIGRSPERRKFGGKKRSAAAFANGLVDVGLSSPFPIPAATIRKRNSRSPNQNQRSRTRLSRGNFRAQTRCRSHARLHPASCHSSGRMARTPRHDAAADRRPDGQGTPHRQGQRRTACERLQGAPKPPDAATPYRLSLMQQILPGCPSHSSRCLIWGRTVPALSVPWDRRRVDREPTRPGCRRSRSRQLPSRSFL
jgi:hypothetical protein